MSKPSWDECRAANMSAREAAEARGVTAMAAKQAARGKWKWREVRSELAAARMKAMHQNPAFAAASSARARAKMTALHQDPAFNPLVLLSPAERAEYDRLMRQPRDAVLAAIGRADLIKGAKE